MLFFIYVFEFFIFIYGFIEIIAFFLILGTIWIFIVLLIRDIELKKQIEKGCSNGMDKIPGASIGCFFFIVVILVFTIFGYHLDEMLGRSDWLGLNDSFTGLMFFIISTFVSSAVSSIVYGRKRVDRLFIRLIQITLLISGVLLMLLLHFLLYEAS